MSTTRENWQSGLGEKHLNVKHSDETLRRVIAMKRAGFSSSEVSTVTGVSVHHVNAVTRGRFRGYLHDELPLGPTLADLIASCPDVGAAIRSARECKGMTQLQLAWAVGVYEGAVLRWEHGKKHPRPSSVRKVAVALGVSPEELLSVKPSA